MPKSRKKKAEPAQANAGDTNSSAAPQRTAAPAEAAAQGSSEPSRAAFMSEDAPDSPDQKKRRVVMYVKPGEVAVVCKEFSQPPAPSGAFLQRMRDRELDEQRHTECSWPAQRDLCRRECSLANTRGMPWEKESYSHLEIDEPWDELFHQTR